MLIQMEDGPVRRGLTEHLVAKYWNTHEHPPLTHVGDKHQYRQADGSLNVSLTFVQSKLSS